MTDRELMQQALDVLESRDGTMFPDEIKIIDALRERLAQSSQSQCLVGESTIRTVPAQAGLLSTQQQTQEPVAWLVQYKDKHEFVWGHKPEFVTNDVLGMEPLYTAAKS